MIGYLKGQAAYLFTDCAFIDVQGVGYRVFISQATRQKLHLHEEILLFTYMSVREDAIQLYGFATQEEYELFLQLISVSGIGPKVALGMLSHITVEALCQAIRQKQTSVLTRLPGIGKKSAERLVLELKDKVAGFGDAVADEELASSSIDAAGDDMLSEAQAALLSLGYNQAEITPVLNKAGKGKNTSEIIKLALKELSKI